MCVGRRACSTDGLLQSPRGRPDRQSNSAVTFRSDKVSAPRMSPERSELKEAEPAMFAGAVTGRNTTPQHTDQEVC